MYAYELASRGIPSASYEQQYLARSALHRGAVAAGSFPLAPAVASLHPFPRGIRG
jgi:hypothetical protein